MGMAASQARYLGLTARKTNTEYEGQQVNQQRTALANQSANLFSQLMALNVPTPPSTEQFTTLQYTYSDGFNTETITNYTPLPGDADYNYTVTHQHTEPTYEGVQYVKTNPAVAIQGGEYWVNNLRTYAYDPATDLQAMTQITTDYPTSNLAVTFADPLRIDEIYSYRSAGQVYYTCEQDMEASRIDPGPPPTPYPINGQPPLNLYYAANLDEQVTTTERGYIQTDASGRLSSVTLESTPTNEFPLTTTQVTDTVAYENAMNQYTYDAQLYEKSIQDINAQTAIIQKEDRELELRLKQLDTEQEALQTEMESVKKVIDKNIESTFKTFS